MFRDGRDAPPGFSFTKVAVFLFQGKVNYMAAIPIWKDRVIDLGAASVEFRITSGGNTIYSGKSIARPGEANAKVRINDICADFLSNALPKIGRASCRERVSVGV